MRSYSWIPSVALLTLGWTTEVNAATVASRCNACNEAQYYTTGVNFASSHGMATGNVYVYDLINNAYRKYKVNREPGAYPHFTYILDPLTPTTDEMYWWGRAKDAVSSNGGRSNFFGHVDARTNAAVPDRQANVYDILLMGAYQNDISDWLTRGSSNVVVSDLGLTTTAIVDTAAHVWLQQDLFTWTVTITTTDGGTIDFHWETGFNHTTITRALDPNGNPIPMDNSQIVGRYRLGPNREPLFRDYLGGKFGGDVTFGSKVCTNGIFACVRVIGTGAYNCDWVSCGGVN